MNKELEFLAKNVTEWRDLAGASTTVLLWNDRMGGPEWLNLKYFPCSDGVRREEWQDARNQLGLLRPFMTLEEEDIGMNSETKSWSGKISLADGRRQIKSEHEDFTMTPEEEEIQPKQPVVEKYAAYQKDVRNLDSIDVYETNRLFAIDDPSGCLQHASKKLLLSGVRTGGKLKQQDIEEARDTLNRWLEMERGL